MSQDRKVWPRFALVVLVCGMAAACGKEEAPRSAGEQMLVEAPQKDAERIGYLLHDRGLLQDPEVQAKQREMVFAANSRQMTQDSVDRVFRAWLDQWVKQNPEMAQAAEGLAPRPLTDEERQADLERVRQRRPRPGSEADTGSLVSRGQ